MRRSEALARGQGNRAVGRVGEIPVSFIGIAVHARRGLGLSRVGDWVVRQHDATDSSSRSEDRSALRAGEQRGRWADDYRAVWC